jgi:hypothetical protein
MRFLQDSQAAGWAVVGAAVAPGSVPSAALRLERPTLLVLGESLALEHRLEHSGSPDARRCANCGFSDLSLPIGKRWSDCRSERFAWPLVLGEPGWGRG